jgi:hypothetical protein
VTSQLGCVCRLPCLVNSALFFVHGSLPLQAADMSSFKVFFYRLKNEALTQPFHPADMSSSKVLFYRLKNEPLTQPFTPQLTPPQPCQTKPNHTLNFPHQTTPTPKLNQVTGKRTFIPSVGNAACTISPIKRCFIFIFDLHKNFSKLPPSSASAECSTSEHCAAGEFPSSIVVFIFLWMTQPRNGKPIVFPLTPNLKSTTSFCSMRHKGSTQPAKPQTRSSTKVSGINFLSLEYSIALF